MPQISHTFPNGTTESDLEDLGWLPLYYLTNINPATGDNLHIASDAPDQEYSKFAMEYDFGFPVFINYVEWVSDVSSTNISHSTNSNAHRYEALSLVTSTGSEWVETEIWQSATGSSPTYREQVRYESSSYTSQSSALTSWISGETKKVYRKTVSGFYYWQFSKATIDRGGDHLDPMFATPDQSVVQKVRWSCAYGDVMMSNTELDAELRSIVIDYTPYNSATYYSPGISGALQSSTTQFTGRG